MGEVGRVDELSRKKETGMKTRPGSETQEPPLFQGSEAELEGQLFPGTQLFWAGAVANLEVRSAESLSYFLTSVQTSPCHFMPLAFQ